MAAPTPAAAPETLITSDASLAAVLPKDFIFACSTAAYQIEGAIDVDGKGPSTWDDFQEYGRDACRSYEHWREDVKLLKSYGVNAYRFSISWPRVRPNGGANDPVNEKGIEYYSNLVDALLAEGIEPVVTLFHWDLPLALEKAYGGLDNTERIVEDFVAYGRLLFERLGDRVTNWITINEPFIYTLLQSAVLKKAEYAADNGAKFDELWAANTRSILLCHARTVDLYRREFKPTQKGVIGITLNMDWIVPFDDTPAAAAAAQQGIDHQLGMYADPIYHGRFPASVLQRFGDKLAFNDDEWRVIKGSNDYFGLNHYSTSWATGEIFPFETADVFGRSFGLMATTREKDGQSIGHRGHNGQPCDVPWGFRLLLRYISDHWTKAAGQSIYVTENGFAVAHEGDEGKSVAEIVDDKERQTFYTGYIREMALAVRDEGIDVGAYMAWSLLDNVEWDQGFVPRYGLTFVDKSTDEYKRVPKDSAFMLNRLFTHLRRKD